MDSIFFSRMCGKLLGDGSIVQQKGRKPRFQFIHRIEDEPWTAYCHEKLRNHIPLAHPFLRTTIDSRMVKGYTESIMVQSKTSPIITELREIWYPNESKQLPIPFITTHLTEEALAWWYQDDGHLKIHNGIMKKIVLSTDSFTMAENLWLIQLLRNKFDLQFSLDGQNRLLLYDQAQIIRFLNIVAPYLQPCMERKAHLLPPLKPIANRTTVYLPKRFELHHPTREINEQLTTLSSFNDYKCSLAIKDSDILQILLQRKNRQPTKPYQVSINYEYRDSLAEIRQHTGLTISELITYCFEQNCVERR
ncbi:endonuclease [Sporosarcina aquimarina]|uniref:endonuclease n=1 Tax=Sporosarcina aquimarina TaxID=114975 RepID=UPI002041CAB5|nr:endonuclease [Sporosarcina aquimarina]MCM3756438.1 endonuclease [Sporosarcina aquimarina]